TAQRPAQVDAAHRIEAEVPHAVGRQAASIAVGAERRRCRRDDAEYGAVAQAEAIRRCRRILDYGLDPAVALLEPLEYLLTTHDLVERPARGAADVHVLDEPHLGRNTPRELDQVDELVVVDTANHDR